MLSVSNNKKFWTESGMLDLEMSSIIEMISLTFLNLTFLISVQNESVVISKVTKNAIHPLFYWLTHKKG